MHLALTVAMAMGLSMSVPAQAGLAAAPMSIAVLEATTTSANCSITTLEGTTTTVACDPAGWTAVLGPGWSAQMTATIHYEYSDNGLPLHGSAGRRPTFQLDPFGFSLLELEFEAGAIHAFTHWTHCHARTTSCGEIAPGGGDQYFGEYGFPPVFVSHNEVADDVSGDISVTTGVRWDAASLYYGLGITWSHTLFVNPSTQVAAIPEPATWLLMVGPLLGLGWLGRRRSAARRA